MFLPFTSLGCLWVLCRGCVSLGLVNWGQGQGSSRDSRSHEMLCKHLQPLERLAGSGAAPGA